MWQRRPGLSLWTWKTAWRFDPYSSQHWFRQYSRFSIRRCLCPTWILILSSFFQWDFWGRPIVWIRKSFLPTVSPPGWYLVKGGHELMCQLRWSLFRCLFCRESLHSVAASRSPLLSRGVRSGRSALIYTMWQRRPGLSLWTWKTAWRFDPCSSYPFSRQASRFAIPWEFGPTRILILSSSIRLGFLDRSIAWIRKSSCCHRGTVVPMGWPCKMPSLLKRMRPRQ